MTTILAPGALPALPLEIMEDFIDLLAPDKDLLLLCSLVSSTWRSRALRHLFQYVALYNQSRLDAMASLLAANPALATHIRDIRFSVMNPPNLSTLPTLRNVEALYFLFVHFTQDATFDNFIGPAGATFPHVHRLILHSLIFSSHLNDVSTSLLVAFPYLSQLCLMYNTYSLSTMPSKSPAFTAGKLRTLQLLSENSDVLDYFADPRLHSLSLLEDFEYHQPPVAAWPRHTNDIDGHYARYGDGVSNLLNAATSLRRVSIFARYTEEMETLLKRVTQRVDFSAHAALRTVVVECQSPFAASPASALLGLIGLIRAICRSTSANDITLSIGNFEGDSGLRVLDALGGLPSAHDAPVELVLKIRNDIYMITSLAALECALGELTRT